MLRYALNPHPETPSAAVSRIDAGVARGASGGLTLHYFVSGKIGDLRLPRVAAPARADELWRHTCFEAFVAAPRLPGYLELNFAPSTAWAAYRFDGYREGMRPATEASAPRIEVETGAGSFTLRATLDLIGLPGNAPWRIGLSAVIEEMSGQKSYWALAHPPGKPDFHHADCHTLQLLPASRA